MAVTWAFSHCIDARLETGQQVEDQLHIFFIWLQMQFQVYPFSPKTSALWLPRQTLSFTWPFTRIILAVSVSVTYTRSLSLTHTDTCYSFRSADTWAVATSNSHWDLQLAVLKSTSYFLRPCCTHGNFPSPTPATESGLADVRRGWGRKRETDTTASHALEIKLHLLALACAFLWSLGVVGVPQRDIPDIPMCL